MLGARARDPATETSVPEEEDIGPDEEDCGMPLQLAVVGENDVSTDLNGERREETEQLIYGVVG